MEYIIGADYTVHQKLEFNNSEDRLVAALLRKRRIRAFFRAVGVSTKLICHTYVHTVQYVQ